MDRGEASLEGNVPRAGFWMRAQIVPEGEMPPLLGGTGGAQMDVMSARPNGRPLEEGIHGVERTEVHVRVAQPAHVFVERFAVFQREDGHLNVDDGFRVQ